MFNLTKAQKDEIRRLTQFANRRIKAAHKVYAKEGKMILPREVVGDLQLKKDWHTENTPLSRSVKFETKEDYQKQMRFLRSFERRRPTVTEYAKNLNERTQAALETALGDVPKQLKQRLSGMSAPKIGDFWTRFSRLSERLGMQFSSESVMTTTIREFFPEDYSNLMSE